MSLDRFFVKSEPKEKDYSESEGVSDSLINLF